MGGRAQVRQLGFCVRVLTPSTRTWLDDVMTSTDFTSRLALALEALTLRCEQRDNFLSDDDVLDAADDWSTDPTDRDLMVEALFDILVES